MVDPINNALKLLQHNQADLDKSVPELKKHCDF